MALDLSRLGMRHQLLGLFGLILTIGGVMLVVDEVAQWRAQQAMQAMKDDVLDGMRRVRLLSDAYGREAIDAAFRVRGKSMDWQAGVAALDRAQATIDREWIALQAAELDAEDRAVLTVALGARPRADAALGDMRQLLEKQDAQALDHFADASLYPAIDPLTQRLERLAERAQARADALVQQQLQRGHWISRMRLGLALLCLGLAAVYGRRILRDLYRGVESLTDLARRMAAHDYTVEPRYRPHGELGEVMEGFLRTRGHVQRIETQLTDQLLNNDRVRVALESREHFQRLLLEAAQTAIFAVDEHGVFSQLNPFAERLLGWPASALLGREKLDVLLEPEAVQALASHLSDVYGQPMPADWTALRSLAQHSEPPREFVLRHQRGRALPVLLALSAMRDDTGAMVGLLAVATDLTALKRLERALRDSEARAKDANEAKSAFLAAMSHEIRTPMIGVTGMIEVLSHTRLDTEQRRSLNVIQASAETLLRIIGDILDFSKIEAGRLEIAPEPTSLPELLHSVAASYGGSASSKGLPLEVRIDPRVGPAHRADPVRLRQVLGNFLSNAIKFTDKGHIDIVLDWEGEDDGAGAFGGDVLAFRVSDTGIGIGQQAQARLFQPFSQAEADTTRRYGGTGLGLAISRRLAELMGGSVEMESTPGKGTCMSLRIRLPRAPASDLPASPGGAARAVAHYVPRRLPTTGEAERERSLVLLVDDHPTNRQVIQRQLALAGYASDTAEDGVAGLEAWRSGRYALVLSDVHMPRMDGYQLAGQIRKDEAASGATRTPVVALTASALKGEAERCLAAGMDDYLAKPVGVPALGACLQRWLPHTVPEQALSPSLGAAVETANNARVVAAEAAAAQLHAAPALTLDPAVLADLTGGSEEDARSLLAEFIASADADMAQLEELRAVGDLTGLTRQAHKIKGAAKLVGAMELADAAAAVEAAGRGGEWSGVQTHSLDLASAVERLRLEARRRGTG